MSNISNAQQLLMAFRNRKEFFQKKNNPNLACDPILRQSWIVAADSASVAMAKLATDRGWMATEKMDERLANRRLIAIKCHTRSHLLG